MQTSPEAIIRNLETLDRPIFVWAGKCEITDLDSQKNAENLLIGAKAAYKRAEAKQKDIVDPILEAERKVRDLFRPYLSKLKLCIDNLNKGLSDFHQEQLRMAREAETYAAAEQAAKIADAKESGEIIDLTPSAEVIKAPAKTSHSEMGITSYKDAFDIRIVQPDLVPRDLCEPSLVKIRARVKSGIIDIPGVLVTKTSIPASRAQ